MSRIICGLQPARETIRAHPERVERVLIDADSSPSLDGLARFAESHGIALTRVPRLELDNLARGTRHQGVVMFAADLKIHSLSEIDLGPRTFLVALDELEDPQNFGAVIRSAVAFGADAILWPEHHSAPLSPTTFRASAGAIEHARLCRVPSLPSALSTLAKAGVSVVGLDANGPHKLGDIDLTGPVVLVVGAEGKGLRKGVKQTCTALASLPMSGPIASLNASVAVALAIYETISQRARQDA